MSFTSWPYISIVIALVCGTVLVILWYKYVERRNGRLVFRAPYQNQPSRCDTLEEQKARLQELMDKTKVVNMQRPAKGPLMDRLTSQRSIMSIASLRAAVSNDSTSEIGEPDASDEGLL
ncbi:hypothetical protein FOZ63_016734 [Perkinsus olseni]|uniref:Uncharacterized protein n=1 Tax=Perkinsus olseni TaxID=32597 RepID=A0A7J6SJD3_PEROL|nr:hypothetical protein FOZ63_016734 [Perkinsus olseni]